MLQRITKFLMALGFVPAILIGTAPIALADASTTGPDSSVSISSYNNTSVTNNNNVTVTNTSTQTATTGDATVSHNTTGGNATTGNASNSNSTDTSLQIENLASMPSAGDGDSFSTTGPDSPVKVKVFNHQTVTNNNNVAVTNNNYQDATTGDAKVSHNTTGGNATSGSANNSNCTSTTINISNGGGAPKAVSSGCNNQPGGGQGGGTEGGGSGSNGQVLGATLTVASVSGGAGAGVSTLPNTGVREGANSWLITAIIVVSGSIVYWTKVIAPRLKYT